MLKWDNVSNISVIVRDIGYLEKKYGDICQFIRDKVQWVLFKENYNFPRLQSGSNIFQGGGGGGGGGGGSLALKCK